MIVCRKPIRLFDADIIGAATLLAVGALAYFAVFVPGQESAKRQTLLRNSIADATTTARTTADRLARVNAEASRLREGVERHLLTAPRAHALTPFLQQVATLAENTGIRVTQVVPEAVRHGDGFLSGDVRYSGEGSSLAFLHLLDQLAQRNPYCAVEDLVIKNAGAALDTPCKLNWTLRLYMLADEFDPRGGLGR